jgi:hypothetical protein
MTRPNLLKKNRDKTSVEERPAFTARSDKNCYIGNKEFPSPKRAEKIPIKDIVVNSCGRPINRKKLKQLQRSIFDQGLIYPITVYLLDRLSGKRYGLCAGQKRLAACQNLGYAEIAAFVVSRDAAKAFGESENLHRTAIGALETSMRIVGYAGAREKLKNVKKSSKGGKQPHDKGYSRISRQTGFSRERVRDAFKHCKLSRRVKTLVEKSRHCDMRAFLNQLWELKSEKEQIRAVLHRATKATAAKKTSKVKAKSHTAPTEKAAILPRSSAIAKATEPMGIRAAVKAFAAVQKLEEAWRLASFSKLFLRQSQFVQQEFLARISA